MRKARIGAALFVGTLALAALAPARAELWCADPLWAHEWGVTVFGPDGRAGARAELPSYFHRRGPADAPRVPRVLDLPPDGGERALPIVHFHSAGSWSQQPIPVALAVGFTHGEATAWFPQVDVRRPAAEARSPGALEARRRVLAQRAALTPMRSGPARVDADPTRQLEWLRLELTREPRHPLAATSTAWVRDLRALDALYASGATESERFVFYEASTSERPALTIARGAQHGPGRGHYVLTNRSTHPVHDLFVVHRRGADTFVFYAPRIPAGSTAGFVLEEHRASDVAAVTRARLRQALVDARQPAPPREHHWGPGECVMQRDPARPVEASSGHTLYAGEIDALLRVWGARMFDAAGTTIVYREDTAYLDEAMPLSVYTDMYHYPVLHRAGLALWEGVALP